MSGTTITNIHSHLSEKYPYYTEEETGLFNSGSGIRDIEVMTKEECQIVADVIKCETRKEYLKMIGCGLLFVGTWTSLYLLAHFIGLLIIPPMLFCNIPVLGIFGIVSYLGCAAIIVSSLGIKISELIISNARCCYRLEELSDHADQCEERMKKLNNRV